MSQIIKTIPGDETCCYQFDLASQPLGEGGMGVIYQGYRVNKFDGSSSPVAIKVLRDEISNNPQLIARAEREASIRINHPNLLNIYGFISYKEPIDNFGNTIVRHYTIMEKIVGVDLSRVLKGEFFDRTNIYVKAAEDLFILYNTNKTKAIACIMDGLMSGLSALHKQGYIHRDIDPSNIMVTMNGEIKLVDFGVCRSINGGQSNGGAATQIGEFIGKVNYAAPELALGDIHIQNFYSDVYSMGILLYQLEVGKLPFTGTNPEIVQCHLSKPLPLNNIKNSKLRKIIKKASEKNPNNRYKSIDALSADLQAYFNNSPSASSYGAVNPKTCYWVSGVLGIVCGIIMAFVI